MTTLDISPGRVAVLTGLESVQERVRQRLHYIRGEWLLNPAGGVPYVTVLLGRQLDAPLVAQEIASEVRRVHGVEATPTVTVDDSEPRRLRMTVTVEAQGDVGDVTVSIGE